MASRSFTCRNTSAISRPRPFTLCRCNYSPIIVRFCAAPMSTNRATSRKASPSNKSTKSYLIIMEIAQDSVVSIHYTLTNDAGDVLDSSTGSDPLAYLQGHGNLIPGLERELQGKKAGDK